MALDSCGKFLKYSIFIVNFIIFLAGVTVVGLGIWALSDGSQMNKILGNDQYASSSAVMLTFGGVVTFIAFLGCCGAIKEVKCLLMTFFIILLLITIGIIAAVVLAFQAKDQVNDVIKDGLYESMKDAKDHHDVKEAWDNIQTKLTCCGATIFSDWQTAAGLDPPDSCVCTAYEDDRCQKNADNEASYWSNGCLEGIKEEIKRHATPLLGIGIAIVVIILLAMVFSCSLFMML